MKLRIFQHLVTAAVSTGRCNTGFKFLCWGLVLQGLSGAFVELACNGAEFSLTKAWYINALGEVLSEKTVGIFVTASLPWRLRITKVNFDLGGHRELRMTGHLGSTIPSQRFVEFPGKLARLLDEGGDDALCVLFSIFASITKREWRSTSVAM